MNLLLRGLLVLVATAGCAPSATLHVWRPAEVDITGLRRIAVLDFRGPGQTGAAARAALVSKLWGYGAYQVVDSTELNRLAAVGGPVPIQGGSLLEVARGMGVDALVTGEVVSYDIYDDRFDQIAIGLGEHQHKQSSRDGKSEKRSDDKGRSLSIEKNETLKREATVSLSFQLLDVHTGVVRAARVTSHSMQGQIVNGEGSLPARERSMTELLDACANDIVTQISPHMVPVTVSLAGSRFGPGSRSVRQGNARARAGDWAGAEQVWKAALEQDPDEHAALHNLAIAAQARQDFSTAEKLSEEAYAKSGKDRYRETRDRIREHGQAFVTATRRR